MPVSPAQPPERLCAIVSAARPALVVVDTSSDAALCGGAAAASLDDLATACAQQQAALALRATPSVCHDDSAAGLGLQPARPLHRSPSAHPEDVPAAPLPYCYVLHTSGSTGVPLGVCGTEEGIRNRVDWMQGQYPLAEVRTFCSCL